MKLSPIKVGYKAEDVDFYSKKDAHEIRDMIAWSRLVIVKNEKAVPA